MVPRRIIVSANCQRGGIAQVLALLLPEAEVSVVSEADEGAAETLRSADLWVRMTAGRSAALDEALGGDLPEIIPWPNLAFGAFHPDVTYVRRRSGRFLGQPGGYHSVLAFWAWSQGLDPVAAETLFTADAYDALGYFDAWAPAEATLATLFAEAGLDFEEFRLGARRLGVFMYTPNHPAIEALALVGRQVVRAIVPGPDRFDDSVYRYLDDHLSVIVWPVYPEIAVHLGVAGSYRWRERHRRFPDLRSWLDACWAAYAEFDPADLEPFVRDDSRFRILEELSA